jgi:chromosome segregation ATPase
MLYLIESFLNCTNADCAGQGETAVKRSLKELKKHNSELRTQLASLVETVDSLFEQRSILLDRVQKDTDSHSALQRQHTESREALAHQTHQLGGMTLEEAELQLHNGLRDVQQVDAELSDESAALALLQAQIEEAEADVRKSIHVLQARQGTRSS